MQPKDMTVYARYEHDDPSKPPVLTEGKITPQMLYRFEQGCKRYFSVEEITQPADQILWTIAGLRDPALSAWFDSDSAQLLTLSFAKFIEELRLQALDPDWETDIRRQMITSKYSLTSEFQTWAYNIVFLNCVLQNTGKHCDNKTLLKILQSNLDDNLDREVRAPKNAVRSDTVRNWVTDVRRIAEAERRHMKRIHDLIDVRFDEVHQRSAKRQATTGNNNTGSTSFVNATNYRSYNRAKSTGDRVPLDKGRA